MDPDVNRSPEAGSPTASRSGTVPSGSLFGGRFQVHAFLRREGGLDVYRAVDKTTDAPVAIRLAPLAVLGPAASQLESDAEKARAVVHKNLVVVLGAGTQSDHVWMATELVDGQCLRELVDGKRSKGRAMSPKGSYNVIAHVANALGEGHPLVVHGALNPANVWINRAGRVKVNDLGLVRSLPALARQGAPAGAVDTLYVAPEVVAAAPATPASDVYSLGAMLYELLTGRQPSPPLIPPSQLSADIPASVDAVIGRAMRRAPEGRFQNALQLKDALAQALAGAPNPSATPPAPAPVAAQPPAPAAAAPAPAIATDGQRPTLGRAFNVAEAAGAAADDQTEGWLIQKGKLDFGPFSLAQIRAQIERGEIKTDHLIVDMESGARTKVKDHAILRDFSRHAERKLEAIRRATADQVSEKVEKKKSVATGITVSVAVLVVVGGVGGYLYTRKAAVHEKLAERADEADIDAFLKNVKLDFAAKASVRRPTRRAGGGPGAGAGASAGTDEFSNDMNLGDVSAGGGDETLGDDVVQRVMMANYRSLVPCIMAERGRSSGLRQVSFEFVIRGSGKVSAVKVNGQRTGPFATCVLAKMQSFGFPKFNGARTIADWSMAMR